MRSRPKQDTTVSVRLGRDEERAVRRLARQKTSTVSDVIRDAVANAVRIEQEPYRPYDQLEDLIGCVPDLPPDLSSAGGERFAEMLREKAGRVNDPR